MSVPLLHASMVENLQKKLVQKDKEIAETNGRENHKASLIRDLQKQLAHKQQETADTIERENQKAVTIRELRKELAQKEKDIVETNERENHNVLLIRDLQEKLAQKEKEVAVDTNERLVQGSGTCFVWLSLSTRLHPISNLCSVSSSSRENPNALLIRDLQEKLAQKDKEIAETNERENHKASLIRDLQKQLAHKKKEAADTIERENQKAVMIRELRKELAWEKNEHAALVRDFEKGNDELAQRIHLQPQVDGETWQFRGDSREWISFPDCPNKELMAKFREGHECFKIVIDGRTYEIDFNKFSQKNVRTKKEREIRCFVDLPSHWQMTTEDALKSKFLKDSLQIPPLNSSFLQQPPAAAGVLPPQRSPNFVQLHAVTDQDMKSKVANLLNRSLSRNDGSHCGCLHGSSNFVVAEAYQVNNLHLWRRYQRCVRSIQDKHKLHGIFPESISPSVGKALTEFARDLTVDLAGNERLLLHGTRDFDLARAIATEGFDNRVARDGLFGRGTYFAAQTCKSAQYATEDGWKKIASPQMVGTMLIARVAIGDPFYTPEPCPADLSRPPEKNGVRADSIIARPGIPNGQPAGVQSHMEVVTFDPGQAYPEFIVRFTEE